MPWRSLLPGKELDDLDFHIKENSCLAWVAAKKLKAHSVAIVLGKTIHLYNSTRVDFLQDKKWLSHELCHLRQFKQYGFVGFIVRYLLESFRHGYYYNRFEIEAREAEGSS
ncbi:hypothetical protein BH11BAC4_BH11BAC4_02580 [soil metagenome]